MVIYGRAVLSLYYFPIRQKGARPPLPMSTFALFFLGETGRTGRDGQGRQDAQVFFIVFEYLLVILKHVFAVYQFFVVIVFRYTLNVF